MITFIPLNENSHPFVSQINLYFDSESFDDKVDKITKIKITIFIMKEDVLS